MGQSNHWWGAFWKKPQAEATSVQCNKFDLKTMIKNLEHSFNTKNFQAFIEVVSTLAQEATSQNSKAMQLLTYLKQQSRAAYRDVVCDPSKLSGDGWFTIEDFEILVNLYRNQKAAKKEESMGFPFLT